MSKILTLSFDVDSPAVKILCWAEIVSDFMSMIINYSTHDIHLNGKVTLNEWMNEWYFCTQLLHCKSIYWVWDNLIQ